MLRIHNTLSGRLEEFRPAVEGEAKFYYCGPTVWDFGHIGNFRSAIAADVLRRYLKFKGLRVTQAMNLTDVDDRIIAKASEAGKSLDEYTAKYIEAFWEDFDALGCQRPEVAPRATQHIPDMSSLISKLEERGHAYRSDGSIYYRISSFPEYGKLSKINFAGNIAGASERVDTDRYDKEDARDFALWKQPAAATEPAWEAPIGRGRPGWHIECSAMSMKYLGETFDIHGGGIDLVFPHHENEIAQSRCVFHTSIMASFWMHNGFLQVEGRKMAKSEDNFITIRELLETEKFGGRSWEGDVLRFAMLQTQYRQPIDWTVQLLEQSEVRLSRWKEFAAERTQYKRNSNFYDEVMGTLCDDLNAPGAFAIIDRTVNSERPSQQDRYTVFKLLRDLGFKGGRSNVSRLEKNFTSVLNGMRGLSVNDWKNVVSSVQERPTLRSGKIKPGTKLIASIGVVRKLLDQLAPVIAPA